MSRGGRGRRRLHTSCARRPRRAAPAPRTPLRAPTTGHLPPHQTRRCRRRFRTTTTGRIRPPSVGSTPNLSVRCRLGPHVVHARGFAQHPFARCDTCRPRSRSSSTGARPRQGPSGRLLLSRASPWTFPSLPTVWPAPRASKMHLTDFCNRLSYTSTNGLLDSWLTLASRRLTAISRRVVPTHPRPKPRGERVSGTRPPRSDEPTRWSFA